LETPLAIRVFNSDFIEDNLRWNETIEPLFLLGAGNIQLQDSLKRKTELYEKTQQEKEAIRKDKTAKEDKIESGLTSKASEIKNILILPDYTKRHLRPLVEKVKDDVDQFLLSEKHKNNSLVKYKSEERKEKISEIEITPVGRNNSISNYQVARR